MLANVTKYQQMLTDDAKCKQMLSNIIFTNFNKFQPMLPNNNKYQEILANVNRFQQRLRMITYVIKW